MEIVLPEKLVCKNCDHKWLPRQSPVRICPRCKSSRWDVGGKTKKDNFGKLEGEV